MIDLTARLAVWLNIAANALGKMVLAPLDVLPGWISATAVAAVAGVVLLAVFKYTSNQKAIERARNDIDANLLALRLFKDSALVALRAQGRILFGAVRLFVLALMPMVVMALPVTLLLGQLSLWYEARPLKVGESSVITLELAGDPTEPMPAVGLEPSDVLDVVVGPVRVRSKRQVCWSVKARQPGKRRLVFKVDDRTVFKEVAVGEGLMRLSPLKPDWDPWTILLNPGEEPFKPDDAVKSISIVYPERSSWTSGTGAWVIYFFVVSMIAAFCFKGVLGVKL